MRRAQQKYVESPLSTKILEGEFDEGDTVIVDYDEGAKAVTSRRRDMDAPVRLEQHASV